jgi:protein CpxP
MHANMLKLQQTKPTDANYSSITSQVSQTHGTLSAQMLAQHAEVRAQVFKVLTPAQQTQLATLEAQMQAHKHGPRGGPAAGDAPPPEGE